jgi:hypothetical protein
MIQEIERFRKTGKRENASVNTANILFIMSGAFTELVPIIQKRLSKQDIGFGARIKRGKEQTDILKYVRSEDLIQFGFESEFVGRLPVRTVFEHLSEEDLYQILKNPNNPIILGKKLDFSSYGIDIKFDDPLLRQLAKEAFAENTGARGLVSAVENALLEFERRLPSLGIKKFAASREVVEQAAAAKNDLVSLVNNETNQAHFEKIRQEEEAYVKGYLKENKHMLRDKYSLTLTPSRIDIVAGYYGKQAKDIGESIRKIKSLYDEIKNLELLFYKNHDINMVLEEDAIDFLIEEQITSAPKLQDVYARLNASFEHGLKLAREKTGRNRFFVTRKALLDPENFIAGLIKERLQDDEKAD